VVRLTPLPLAQRPTAHKATIERLVRAAFGQRRKTLSNSLDGLADADDLRSVDIDPGARAEQIAPQSFIRLAAHLDAR
jgi:16S rRNA (adenine1518-N6/adenine1519-N6)-dimethyltransferase